MEGVFAPGGKSFSKRQRKAHLVQAPRRETTAQAPPARAPESEVATALHDTWGNTLTAEALSGTGPVGLLAAEALVDAASGLTPGSDGLLATSNAARVVAMRRASVAPASGGTAEAKVALALQRGGRALPAELRARLESALGVSLASVAIHTDDVAHQAAVSINAVAFTVGTDIYFSRGSYQPGTQVGDELIAHEATHAAQHLEGRSGRPSAVEDGVPVTLPTDAVEREAYAMGAAFARGEVGAVAEPDARDLAAPTADHGVEPGAGGAAVESAGVAVEAAPDAAVARDAGPTRAPPGTPAAGVDPATPGVDPATPGVDPNAPGVDPNAPGVDPNASAADGGVTPPVTGADVGVPSPSTDTGVDPAGAGPSGGPTHTPAPTVGAGGGTGGGSVGPAPAVTPGGGGGAARTPDGLVDYYMETHWDRAAEYDAAIEQFGLSDAGFGTALDNYLPAQMSPGVRGALNLATAFSSGIIDALILGGLKAIPGAGSILHVATGIRDIWSTANTYGELGDGWGMAINIIRNVADLVGSVVGNIADLGSVVQDIAAISVVGAPLAAVVAFFGSTGRTVAAVCDGIKVTCSTISTVRNVMMANEARRDGDHRRAAKYNELASSDAINVVVDGISAVASIGSAMTVNVVPGEAVEDIAEAGGQSFRSLARSKALDGALGADSNMSKAFGEWFNRTGGMQGPLGLIQGATNLRARLGLGDVMSLSPDGAFGGHAIEPSGGGSDAIGVARQLTIDQFQASWTELEGNNPAWTQKIINDIVAPAETSPLDVYTGFLSPTTWIRTALSGIRGAGHLIENVSAGGLSAVLRGVGGGLTGLVQPAVDQINTWVRENKPALDELLANLSESISRQRVSLDFLRTTTGTVHDFLGQVSHLADGGGGIDRFVQQVTGRIGALRVTKESLGIPDCVPEATYAWALRAWNRVLSGVVGGIEALRARALPAIDAFVDEQTAWGQAELERIQAAIAEGGEVEQMLQGAYDSVAAGIASFVEMFTSWDATMDIDVQGAVAWLTETAATVDAAAFDARVEQFRQFLLGEAQGKVDQWRADHGDAVEQAYYPEIPQHEIDALDTVYQRVQDFFQRNFSGDAADTGEHYLSMAQRGYDQARAAIGQRGEGAIESFWEGAERVRYVAGISGA